MLPILRNALREKIRRRELYIVVGISVLLIALLTSGSGSLSVAGKPLTGFAALSGFAVAAVTAIGSGLAVALSLSTIPREYDRQTSHLVLIRGVSQRRYHAELALANLLASLAGAALLYLSIALLAITGDGMGALTRMPLSFGLVALCVTVSSLLTSALSIVLPSPLAGLIALVFMGAGLLHGWVDLMSHMVSGGTGMLLRGLSFVTPDLGALVTQSQRALTAEPLYAHPILCGLLTAYLAAVLLLVLRRRPA